MTRVPFVKMEGAGNDYVFVDAIRAPFPFERAAELAQRWSDRHRGIGADGLIVVTRVPDAAVGMAMWNRDGSRGAMCGNGLRCVARLARDHGHVAHDRFVVATDAGPREVELLAGDLVRTSMGDVHCEPEVALDVDGRTVTVVPGSAGNPHAVVFVADVDAAPVHDVGSRLQRHPRFADGVNVEFVQVLAPDRLRQRTFERGSGETLACGTGAAVAALAAHTNGLATAARIAVELRGGTLHALVQRSSLAVEGPARTVFRGEIELPGFAQPGAPSVRLEEDPWNT